jgi:hypothetical protein
MSRTQKGKKGVGYEYWSKRPGNCLPPGKTSKKLTHARERAQQKEALLKEPIETEYDAREWTPPMCSRCDGTGMADTGAPLHGGGFYTAPCPDCTRPEKV